MRVKIYVIAFLSLLLGLSLAICEFNSPTQIVDFGYIPEISNIPERTYSAWIYPHVATTHTGYIMGVLSDEAGSMIGLTNDLSIILYHKGLTWPGMWLTAGSSVNLNEWTHVVVARDSSNPTNLPTIYINGVAKSITQTEPQLGQSDETGSPFTVGNITNLLNRPFDGLIKECRVYNRLLTAGDALDLYNGVNVTDGLKFYAPSVKSIDIDSLDGQALTEQDKLIDGIGFIVGTPSDGVILHKIP